MITGARYSSLLLAIDLKNGLGIAGYVHLDKQQYISLKAGFSLSSPLVFRLQIRGFSVLVRFFFTKLLIFEVYKLSDISDGILG